MILAADVGGSKTLVGRFAPSNPRPTLVDVVTLRTLDYDGLPALLHAALGGRDARTTAVSLGVAGPVIGDEVTMTNVPWRVRASEVAAATGVAKVRLLNDLEAMAWAVPVLSPAELHTLQVGRGDDRGNLALIAAGTGLGEAILHRVGHQLVPLASEAGHSDFAARTPDELALVEHLRGTHGRADIEHVVSGIGLASIAAFTHRGDVCAAAGRFDAADAPARLSSAATEGTCTECRATLDLFVDAYGAEAGNLALRSMATAGVFVGGGIAPKILPLLDRRFMGPFLDKAPMQHVLERIPVHVILNEQAALLGAAVAALSP